MSPLPVAVPVDLDTIAGRLPTALVCSGCGYRLPQDEPIRLRCPMARPDDDTDHVLRRILEPSRLRFPTDTDPNPFVRYRTLLHAYHVARAVGWSDGDLVDYIARLDSQVARVDGHGFEITPFHRADTLGAAVGIGPRGALLVKDETGNVSGSHKARHLFGVLLELELAGGDTVSSVHPLAIASCGNAALAAAVVERLRVLGTDPIVCEREPGTSGDPTYHRLRQELERGAIPFTCQGNLNGLAIEGGETLGWEMVSDLLAADERLDHVVIQVGGGALASSVMQAFSEARQLGAISTLPRFHTVQTHGAFPLARAYELVAARLRGDDDEAAIEAEIAWAATHRSAFMWPWETEPRSMAGGILDDETYDWVAVVRGMLLSGGGPVVVDEDTLREANRLGRATTGIDVDFTGSSGLAGAFELVRRGEIGPDDRVAVIFTGIRREPAQLGEPT